MHYQIHIRIKTKLLELHYPFKEFKMAKKAKKKTEKKTNKKTTKKASAAMGGMKAGRKPIAQDKAATGSRAGRRARGGPAGTKNFGRFEGVRNRGR